MEKILWNVYQQFRCIAEKCPDSCCQGWEVDIDEKAAQDYRSRQGDLARDLQQVLKTEQGSTCMVLQDGRCPMWRKDGLCRIQAAWGHDALCQVCREYPRLFMDYGDFAEWGLELSCPEAARLIFRGITVQTVTAEDSGPAEYDRELMILLRRSRETVLEFWENTDMTVSQALAVTLMYAHQVQSAIDGGEYPELEPETCLHEARKYADKGDMSLVFAFFKELEILTESWKQRLDTPAGGCWDPGLRHLAVYMIRRYWLQAVWDFDLICRVKFMISACLLVNALGGDPQQTAQLFAKEIENDPDNREAILDGAYANPGFTDVNLLSLLL